MIIRTPDADVVIETTNETTNIDDINDPTSNTIQVQVGECEVPNQVPIANQVQQQ
jgi:hypothetical protein